MVVGEDGSGCQRRGIALSFISIRPLMAVAVHGSMHSK